MDKKNFEKDIDVPSKRLDRIDKMEIDLANYEQMERDIEKIIEPYQLNWELDCLSLPNAIQSILERKEQECEDWQETLNECCLHGLTLMTEKRVLLQTLTEIKKIAEDLIIITDEYDNCYHKDECDKCLLGIDGNCQYIKVEQILQKISECEGNND